MAEFYLNLANYSVGVKTGEFFREQGGLRQSWGRKWVRVEADSGYEARLIGVNMKKARGESVLEIERNPHYADERKESARIRQQLNT